MYTYQVTGVRTETSASGYHEHISHVRIGAQAILERQTVVTDIKSPIGDRYFTNVNSRRADVLVVSCPNCSFRDYLRTSADSTSVNNLLSLPRV